jgi:hypothetical protein
MRSYLPVTIILAVFVSACEPSSRLYLTPPIYFASSHAIPVTDSNNKLSVSASLMLPPVAELKAEYRVNKNLFTIFSYSGKMGGYSEFSNNDIDYRYATNSFDWQAGYRVHRPMKKDRFFIVAGYGRGKTTSIVPEFDNSIQFVYKGNYSKFSITPAVQLINKTRARFIFSWRQSFVNFNEYLLPDTAYYNKRQFLSDMMLSLFLTEKQFGLNFFFLGGFLNGREAGNRQFDYKPEVWRIERFYMGINLSYKFLHKK